MIGMLNNRICTGILLLLLSLTFGPLMGQQGNERLRHKVEKRFLRWQQESSGIKSVRDIPLDSFHISVPQKTIHFYYSKNLSYLPIREDLYSYMKSSLSQSMGRKFKDYAIAIYTNGSVLEDLIPNSMRKDLPLDKRRMEKPHGERIPLVRRLDKEPVGLGLYNYNIALWPSHGLYYEPSLDRWEYQRARLFGTVEDLYPMSYILPYLIPMLENAGANVFIPRERDTQKNEVIVDNDKSTGNSEIKISEGLPYEKLCCGFQSKDSLIGDENPFRQGTYLKIQNSSSKGEIRYIPEIPEKGSYAVYVSYRQDSLNSMEVPYTIRHAGGESHFLVNQKIGGSTWVYLGTFDFFAGKDPEKGAVLIKLKGTGGEVTADAVRFGGGMGSVARKAVETLSGADSGQETVGSLSSPGMGSHYTWKKSGKPRYMEAARYYLQYAGMPDSLVFSLNQHKNDYTDDLQCRGEWVNYLIGKSKDQYRKVFNSGLNIPIDLSFAFHTDAGITPGDSVIGTLGLYSTEKNDGLFPDGQSKMTSRDLTDMIQTQLVEDIRKEYNPGWVRREMWDRGFSEAYRPVVPAMLLELLSHQNLADMRLGLDPGFRFQVSRSIYKGILKYLSYQQGRTYVIQPLPVKKMAITSLGNKTIRITWSPQSDSLEPSVRPTKYKLYQRDADGGFDNGTLVQDSACQLVLPEYNKLYSFKVTALNEGGESLPGEILSAGFVDDKTPVVLVVNGFDRISGPSLFDQGEMAGISWWDDQGVPDKADIGFLGDQYNFDRKSEWVDDDNAGWGACHTDMDGKIIPGNTFDFPKIHGHTIMANGYSFVSVSKEAFTDRNFNVHPYILTDVILGEEKSTPRFEDPCKFNYSVYTSEFREKINEISRQGGGIFISGAYTGTDLTLLQDSDAIRFARDILHFTWRTNHASRSGHVYSTDYANRWFQGTFDFNTRYRPDIYSVEAPDALEPSGKNAVSAFRYDDSKCSAGVVYSGKYKSVVLGFPFETLTDKEMQKSLMAQILRFCATNK